MLILKVIKDGQGLRVGEKYKGRAEDFMGYGNAYYIEQFKSYYLNSILAPVIIDLLDAKLKPIRRLKIQLLGRNRVKIGSRTLEKSILTTLRQEGNIYLYSDKNSSKIRIQDVLDALEGVY